jgi:putative flippase GtrA
LPPQRITVFIARRRSTAAPHATKRHRGAVGDTGSRTLLSVTTAEQGPGLSARVRELYERPIIHKFWKYSMTSVVGVVLGQSLLFLFASVVQLSWGWANLWAVAISTAPTYYMSRRWVWSKTGKSSFYAEVLPFWVLTFLGLLLSTIAVVVLEHRYPDNRLLANVGNVIGFGVLWVAKFFVLDRLLFTVTHEHIETPTPFV